MADSNITKRTLASALKELMESTPFTKITVSDICAKCNMNRKSFYYHFKDKFDLVNFVDKATGFISYKSKNGKDLKALELPGLWNGAMSDWNTVFVEVPLSTFNPVKTVNDLLRDQHQ